MGLNTYEKEVENYLKNRTWVSGKCMQPATESVPLKFCSKVVITDEPACYCQSYINPDEKWRNGDCPLADQFLKASHIAAEEKKRVGQQKQKKKNRRG
jgi:hypothetical protein